MKASNYVINFLVEKEIEQIFGYIGGAVAHLYHSVANNENIEIVNCINEQAVGFAAEGYSRVTGKSGVSLATSGPGATNLITPIGSCFFDSVPTLFITGQVNTYEYKYEKPVRQVGFQETDIVSIVTPITKYAVMINDVNDLRFELEKAYYLSQHNRKGPVLVDIPMDIQRTEADFNTMKSFFDSEEFHTLEEEKFDNKIEDVVKALNNSKRCVVLVGGGVSLSKSNAQLQSWLENYNIPVVYSLMGKDSISDDYEFNLGLIGSYGNRYGNLALANSDLILVLGSRLDTRQTGTDLKTFAREAKIIQVDVDRNELGSKIDIDLEIYSNIANFIVELKEEELTVDNGEWLETLRAYKNEFSSTVGIDNNVKIPNLIISKISEYINDEVVTVDVGQHQMWTAQSLNVNKNQKVLFSGGMGAMGFALPSAIGAAIATNKRVIAIAGDGGVQMNIQELEVLKRRNLPIKVIVLNNQNLGMVRQFQELYFEKKYSGTINDYSVPNLVKIADAYGLKSREIDDLDSIDALLEDIFSNNEPELINIILNEKMTTVEPKLIVNKPIENMHPFLDKNRLHDLMIIEPLDD